jgi:hypothetical protein
MRPKISSIPVFACVFALWGGFGIAGDDFEDAVEIMNHPVELTDMAKQSGADWMIRGVEVDGLGLANLRLEQVEVFAADAKIIINDGVGETIQDPPGARFLRGEIEGVPGSIVALMQTEDGDLSGLMTDGNAVWELKRPSATSPLETSAIDASEVGLDKPFACGQEKLPEVPGALDHLQLSGLPDIEALPAGQLYEATIAIETDYELYQRFGSTSATGNYIGNLFNYVGGIYELELQTRLKLGNVYLWTTSADPWVETGSTTCRLYEFGRYWRNNRASVPRTLAHFLSGRSLGGGVAWLDQLCQPARSITRSTGCATVGSDFVYGGFGVSANLTGTIGTSGGPAWDAVVVAHEIGHNFSSPHTHCYGNIGGSSSPVDACWNLESGAGCWAGGTRLPGVNSLSGGTASGRNGTIMSYCHQHSGGIANIAGTLGLGHLFGVNAARVPNRMASRVAAVASANPSCIPVVSGRPDFAITGITLNPSNPASGSTFSATVTVRNQGTVSGSAGQLAVWANRATVPACGATGNQRASVGTLAAGASRSITFTGLSAGTAGSKTFRAFVDSGCATVESNEGNNQLTSAYTVVGGGPDFLVTAITLNPSNPASGSTFSATVTVLNQGTVSGSAGQLAVWANRATVPACGATGNQRASVGTLAAGASRSITFTGLSAGTAGSKTFRAFVDSGCATAESNEGNNQLTSGYTVGDTTRPDFLVTAITLTPPNPASGSTFSATVTVRNQGTVSGSAGQLAVWANRATVPACGATGNQRASAGTLAAGASRSITFTGLSAGTSGNKTFRAFVDSGCATVESNEGNNQLTSGYTTGCSATSTPITVGTSINGSLATTDCFSVERLGGHYRDNFTFDAIAGTTYTIDLTSSAFDTYLYLVRPTVGVLAQDDDGGGGTNSRIIYRPTVSGTLRIQVTSFSPGATGTYRLSLARGSGS